MVPNPGLTNYNNNVSSSLSATELKDYYRLYDITYKSNGYIDECEVLDSKPLWKLLEFAGSDMRQQITNPDVSSTNIWSTADWKTALYSLKTKRFKCDGIEYSTVTGRVCRIYFSEID
jgi:hypothetical protein